VLDTSILVPRVFLLENSAPSLGSSVMAEEKMRLAGDFPGWSYCFLFTCHLTLSQE